MDFLQKQYSQTTVQKQEHISWDVSVNFFKPLSILSK